MVDLYTGTVPNLTQSQPDFDTNTQAILDYIGNLAPQLNEWVGAYVQDTSSASSTSNTIGTGSKTFTVDAGKGYKVNMPVRASATIGNYMDGIITAYSGTSLTVNFTSSNGSGTFTSWHIFLTIPGSNVTLGSNTFTGDQIVPDEAYDATGWNGDLSVPTKNAIRDQIELNSTYLNNQLETLKTQYTSIVSASGKNNIDFDVPSGAKKYVILLENLSSAGITNILVQLGSTTIQTSGYDNATASSVNAGAPSVINSTSGFPLINDVANDSRSYIITIYYLTSNTYLMELSGGGSTNRVIWAAGGGRVTLAGPLNKVRITTISGTDNFDSGNACVLSVLQ